MAVYDRWSPGSGVGLMKEGRPVLLAAYQDFYELLRRSMAALRSPFVIFERPLMPSLLASL